VLGRGGWSSIVRVGGGAVEGGELEWSPWGCIEAPEGECWRRCEMALLGLLGLRQPVRFGGGDEAPAYTQPWWWIWAGISVFLVLFAGIMSGLTLGLMSLGLIDLEVLQQSGTDDEKEQASTFPSTITARIFFSFRFSTFSYTFPFFDLCGFLGGGYVWVVLVALVFTRIFS
jgi:hypothetical protein